MQYKGFTALLLITTELGQITHGAQSAQIHASFGVASQSGKLVGVRSSSSIVNSILKFLLIADSSGSSGGGGVVILSGWVGACVSFCMAWRYRSCHTLADEV